MDHERLANLTGLALLIGEPVSTVKEAAMAGHIKTVTVTGGTVLYVIESAKRWSQSERKRGRPKVKA